MHEYENFQITIVGAKPNYDDDGNVFYISVVIVERRGHPRQVQSFMTEEPYVPIKKAKKYINQVLGEIEREEKEGRVHY